MLKIYSRQKQRSQEVYVPHGHGSFEDPLGERTGGCGVNSEEGIKLRCVVLINNPLQEILNLVYGQLIVRYEEGSKLEETLQRVLIRRFEELLHSYCQLALKSLRHQWRKIRSKTRDWFRNLAVREVAQECPQKAVPLSHCEVCKNSVSVMEVWAHKGGETPKARAGHLPRAVGSWNKVWEFMSEVPRRQVHPPQTWIFE